MDEYTRRLEAETNDLWRDYKLDKLNKNMANMKVITATLVNALKLQGWHTRDIKEMLNEIATEALKSKSERV